MQTRLSTPRVEPLPESEWSDEQRELLEVYRKPVIGIFRTLVRHPKLLKRWRVFGSHVLSKQTLPARDRVCAPRLLSSIATKRANTAVTLCIVALRNDAPSVRYTGETELTSIHSRRFAGPLHPAVPDRREGARCGQDVACVVGCEVDATRYRAGRPPGLREWRFIEVHMRG